MASYNEHDYYDLDSDVEVRSESTSAQALHLLHHRQASDTRYASSEVSQRQVSPYTSLSPLPPPPSLPAPAPPTSGTPIHPTTSTAANFTALNIAAGPSPSAPKTTTEAFTPPSAAFPSDHNNLSFLPNSSIHSGLASQRSTRSNTLSSDYNPNQVIKRKPLSATASALAVRYSSSTSNPLTSNTNSPTTSQDPRSSPGALAYQPSHSRETSVYSTSSYAFSEVYVFFQVFFL